MLVYNSQPKTKDVHINMFNSNKNLLKIAHIPDLHLNGDWDFDIEKFKSKINQLDVDFVIYNGDVFNNYNLENISFILEELANINSKYGSYVVLGNREGRFEYQNSIKFDLQKNIQLFNNSNLKILKNLTLKINNIKINIKGISDIHSDKENYFKDIEYLNLEKISNSILFCHNPIIQNNLNFDNLYNNLIISGHTHGAQIFPFGYLKIDKSLKGIFKKRRGFYKLKNKNQIFIGNGSGFNHSNFRFLARNYIDIIYIK